MLRLGRLGKANGQTMPVRSGKSSRLGLVRSVGRCPSGASSLACVGRVDVAGWARVGRPGQRGGGHGPLELGP